MRAGMLEIQTTLRLVLSVSVVMASVPSLARIANT